jgi:hypothetical protein
MGREEKTMRRRVTDEEIDRILDLLAEDDDGPAEKERGEAGGDGGGAQGPWLVRGILVHVGDRRFRGFLGAVLDRIGSRRPEDLDRIRRRVSRVEPLPPGAKPPNVAASYGDPARGAPEYIPGPDGGSVVAAWPIRVAPRLIEASRDKLVEGLVHELGHAVATPDDIEIRSDLGRGWGQELAADHCAARWGFGRLIRSMRPDRSAAHHGPVPGERVEVRFGGHAVCWRVTPDRVPVREDGGRRG